MEDKTYPAIDLPGYGEHDGISCNLVENSIHGHLVKCYSSFSVFSLFKSIVTTLYHYNFEGSWLLELNLLADYSFGYLDFKMHKWNSKNKHLGFLQILSHTYVIINNDL